MPVIVGVGQVSEKEFDLESLLPRCFDGEGGSEQSSRCRISVDTMAEVDTLAVVKSFREGNQKFS